ncbi:MAG: DUF4091 domain-containing protein [Clostridia bacterium]|nr:DUF4091 domain-containing protein [Clostridia bacterium]
MELRVKQISYLEKVRISSPEEYPEINEIDALKNQRVCYQIVLSSDKYLHVKAHVESDLPVSLYCVRDVFADTPFTQPGADKDGYIINEPGMIPDVLIPLEEQNGFVTVKDRDSVTLFVKVNVPENAESGKHEIKVNFEGASIVLRSKPEVFETAVMTLDVGSAVLDGGAPIYTRWFYADCIAVYHNVEVYSEKHWEFIEKYIAAATEVGINMILTPVHTPPLDTEIDTARPNVQLVDIEKKDNRYVFGFDKLERFVTLAQKHGIKYFEIAHMFSQWGAEKTPNIYVTVNGRLEHMFGWHTTSDSREYISFLGQYVPALREEFEKLGIDENTYFHVSDEPRLEQIEKYKTAMNLIKPYIGKCKTLDALSHYEFYETGLVECPVTIVSELHHFIPHNIENLWAYYCCGPQVLHTNSLLAMPSYRVQVLGFLLYKFNIKGFLHWGFNYYNAERSKYPLNPYINTSADGSFPSGDGFIVYPGYNSVYGSIRGEVTYQAIEDMRIATLLEKKIGREKVVEMIDNAAGGEFRFPVYPKNGAFLENLRREMIRLIEE